MTTPVWYGGQDSDTAQQDEADRALVNHAPTMAALSRLVEAVETTPFDFDKVQTLDITAHSEEVAQ